MHELFIWTIFEIRQNLMKKQRKFYHQDQHVEFERRIWEGRRMKAGEMMRNVSDSTSSEKLISDQHFWWKYDGLQASFNWITFHFCFKSTILHALIWHSKVFRDRLPKGKCPEWNVIFLPMSIRIGSWNVTVGGNCKGNKAKVKDDYKSDQFFWTRLRNGEIFWTNRYFWEMAWKEGIEILTVAQEDCRKSREKQDESSSPIRVYGWYFPWFCVSRLSWS
jgi:hypothetical protein